MDHSSRDDTTMKEVLRGFRGEWDKGHLWRWFSMENWKKVVPFWYVIGYRIYVIRENLFPFDLRKIYMWWKGEEKIHVEDSLNLSTSIKSNVMDSIVKRRLEILLFLDSILK